MNRIDQMWTRKKQLGEKCFIPFIMGGVPSLEASRNYVNTCIKAGCSLIEIGIPFSDPIADGPVIARAHAQGVAHQVTLAKVLELVSMLRQDAGEVPIVLMLYSNIIYHMGIDAFFDACDTHGVDGVIVPDLPVEECEIFEACAKCFGVYLIRLIAPTSKQRIKTIVSGAQGFLYCVSSRGVTGMREGFDEEVIHFLASVKEETRLPLAVGFGISKPCHVTQLLPYVDAVIVGSAIVDAITKESEGREGLVIDFLTEIMQTIKN